MHCLKLRILVCTLVMSSQEGVHYFFSKVYCLSSTTKFDKMSMCCVVQPCLNLALVLMCKSLLFCITRADLFLSRLVLAYFCLQLSMEILARVGCIRQMVLEFLPARSALDLHCTSASMSCLDPLLPCIRFALTRPCVPC